LYDEKLDILEVELIVLYCQKCSEDGKQQLKEHDRVAEPRRVLV
jgi:hypothetical protein